MLLEAIRFTRLSAGRYNHWSSESCLWLKVNKAVPLTSLGWSKITKVLSPSLCTSSVRLRMSRMLSSPCRLRRIMMSSAVKSSNPVSRLSASIAMASPFSSAMSACAITGTTTIIIKINITNIGFNRSLKSNLFSRIVVTSSRFFILTNLHF